MEIAIVLTSTISLVSVVGNVYLVHLLIKTLKQERIKRKNVK